MPPRLVSCPTLRKTINEAQGRSWGEHVFSHRQLYVALSGATIWERITVLLPEHPSPVTSADIDHKHLSAMGPADPAPIVLVFVDD
jgi:hypothetical protein